MLQAQHHRGPDDGGQQILAAGPMHIGFGMRRLAIIDLSQEGHQPMVHPETGDVLVYNGELYNFKELRRQLESAGSVFRGHSDTEVLLHALVHWGPDCLDRLQGMYAFAFYMVRENRLLLGRDPLGIKPLYVCRSNRMLLFASEVRAILATGLLAAEIDPRGLATFLAYGAVQAPCTIAKGIQAFPAACFQSIQANNLCEQHSYTRRYWHFPVPRQTTEKEAVHQLQSMMDDSVRDHLVSDVPVAVFLSSGLDSTVTTSLAANHLDQLRTFTVGFADESDMSEANLAEETGRLLGVNHTNIPVTGRDCEALALEWLHRLDQPSIDGLNVFVISKLVRQQGITVALSGLGGDELFGGYPSFQDVPRLQRIVRNISWAPRGTRSIAARLATIGRSYAVREKLTDMFHTSGDLFSLFLHRRRAMSDGQLSSLGVDAAALGLTNHLLAPEATEGLALDESDPVWIVSQLESRFYMGNMLLRDADACSMAHSLEIRVPFLDRRIIDFAFSVPGRVRLPRGHANKHLIRKAFSSMLRPALTDQSKRGFTLPIRRWMVGPLRDSCEQMIDQLKQSELLKPEGVTAIWSAFIKEPESPMWTRAWSLCILGFYLDQFKRAASIRPAQHT